MNKARIWLEAVRPKFFTGSIIPIVLGAVIAWNQTGRFNWLYFILTLVGGLFIHAGLDLANDYFDHTSGVDEVNKISTPFSGGSRMIQKKILLPTQVLAGSLICFSVGIVIGLYLNYLLPGNTILLIGMFGVFLAFFYTAGPFRIGYTGFGELAVGLGFGPAMVMGAYFVQAKHLSWVPLFAAIPVGMLIALVLYINEFPDYEADKTGKKRTLVVILGKEKAIKLYYILLSAVYLLIVYGIVSNIIPYFAAITLITIPLFIKSVKTAKANYNKIDELLPANAATIGLHLTIGLLLSISFILDKLIV